MVIFDLSKMIIPVHHEISKNTNNSKRIDHWSLIELDFIDCKCRIYNSLQFIGGNFHKDHLEDVKKLVLLLFIQETKYDASKQCLQSLKTAENIRRKFLTKWGFDDLGHSVPQQIDMDCGMFVMKFADFLMDNIFPQFCHKNVKYFRARTFLELMKGKLLEIL